MTDTRKRQLARELDTRIRYLRLTGLDDTALFLAMAGRMDDFKALADAAGPNGVDSLAGRLPDLRYYAQLLTSIQDGTIKMLK